MLSLTKINSSRNQSRSTRSGDGYLFYMQTPSIRERSDFAEYVRGPADMGQPPPFWAGDGARLLGLGETPEPEHLGRLARGFSPLTGEPLVQGAGDRHVMGLDMTFSAPKDVSVVFAAADAATQTKIIECLQDATRAALRHAESGALTRHEHGGRVQRAAEATLAACHTHFSSRSGDPQLHIHAFMLNVGKRRGSNEWSALELRPQFERKLATGAIFRVELAWRLREMGFSIVPDGPYFQISGIEEAQRDALSTRSKQIKEYLKELNAAGVSNPAAKGLAALNTRDAKAEPPLPELLTRFKVQAASVGLNAAAIERMRSAPFAQLAPETERESDQAAPSAPPFLAPPAQTQTVGGQAQSVARDVAAPFEIDRAEILRELMSAQSCATAQDALAAICAAAMGRWSAAECVAELDRLMASDLVVRLGTTAHLTEVFSSKERRSMEAAIDARVRDNAASRAHALDPALIDREFDALEDELRAKLGVDVSLAQQRAAARHLACETGCHAFVVGWAGTGKTTMLRAATRAFSEAGFSVVGCCQSASAAQNLARETGARSRTIASLLIALASGRAKLNERSVLLLDEAGMVGSQEFALLQHAALKSGAKFICVGDPKQLQPIEGGGIFASLIREHGAAEISQIQRQRTDYEPLLAWLDSQAQAGRHLAKAQAAALREAPEDTRMDAIKSLCEKDAKLSRAFAKWRARFDNEWLREAVAAFATGAALPALRLLDAHGRLRLLDGPDAAIGATVGAWAADKTALRSKIMIAGTRAEVCALNDQARALLVEQGIVQDGAGTEIAINFRDGTTQTKRFAPGDRVVFTKNDRQLGVANGAAGTIKAIEREAGIGIDGRGALLLVELDDENEFGKKLVSAPSSFGWFDLAFCFTNSKSQGRTVESAHVLVNPLMADREWSYVAASRSRFATTIYIDASAIAAVDPESHLAAAQAQSRDALTREQTIESLARRMSRSRAKETTLDYPKSAHWERPAQPIASPPSASRASTLNREADDDRSRESERRESRARAAALSRGARSAIRRLFGLAPEKKRGKDNLLSR